MEPLRKYETETVERRASRRVEVTCRAVLRTMTTQTDGTIADMSESGARFEAPDAPGPGATALLQWGDHEAVCTIVWSQDGACGLAFKQALAGEIVAEAAELNRVVEMPIASVGNITQGRRRSESFLKLAVVEEAPRFEPVPAASPGATLAEVLGRFRRGRAGAR